MRSKWYCKLKRRLPATSAPVLLAASCVAACLLAFAPLALAGDAPNWMHALVMAPLPEHSEKTDAILLFSETNVTVLSADKIKTHVREAYKILRPNGREHGTVVVYINPQKKLKSLHGWCIPAQGKDFEVKDKDATEVSPQGFELVQDVRAKVLQIPAADVGNIVGYEYEVEEAPFFLQDNWTFQVSDPVRESHYSLQLPTGWEFKASWLNHPEVKPTQAGSNEWQWTVTDVKWLREEAEMPPFSGIRGQMIISFFPPGGVAKKEIANWEAMGRWYWDLVGERADASPQIKSEVTALTAEKTTPLQKMQALAQFVQHDIRYVAIELGIGGYQPHPAPDVFSNRYGDCKDKATLMHAMLHEIGVESYLVVIHTHRGSVTPDMPAHNGFNHVITAIKVPDGLTDPSLVATVQHPKLGRILFFDPTNQLTPFGQLSGELQANYGLLVTPSGGELLQLPQQPTAMNSITRSAKLTLDPTGTLRGDVKEVRIGDRAWQERWRLTTVTKDADRIKPIEELLGNSLSSFRITHATLINLQQTSLPFGFDYSFESQNYARNAGDLILVRPRVMGNKGAAFLETKEPRLFPIEFEGPALDQDTFEITLPPGCVVDELPPPVDVDFGFASYHSKTVVNGSVLNYTRTYEVKELTVPVSKSEELRKFYRIVAGDERNTAVFKLSQSGR